MAYDFYIGTMLLPVPPEKMTIKVKGNNKTYALLDDGEVNVLKTPGLTEISFDMLLPNTRYPFSVYKQGFQRADIYLQELGRLKLEKKTFQFIISRALPDGSNLFGTNITCSLEDYSIKEDAGGTGTDVLVSVSLKQYREYGVKKCRVKTKKKLNLGKIRKSKDINLPGGDGGGVLIHNNMVSVEIARTITLCNLAKKIYGSEKLYTVLQEANAEYAKAASVPGEKPKPPVKVLWKRSKKLKKGTTVMVPLKYYS